ncbi:MAG: hypothetical protein ACE5G7_04230 [Candidatus Hydrothermarchaeaceae archaeon]
MKLPFDLKDITPGSFAYLTKRKLTNKEGEEKGEIFLWKRRDEEESQYVLKCPYCEAEQEGYILLAKRPYRVRCSNCDRSITLPKLKDEVKKGGK